MPGLNLFGNRSTDLDLNLDDEVIVKSYAALSCLICDNREATPEQDRFDQIIAELENILMDEELVEMQSTFLAENAHHFTADDENKLIYTSLFHAYGLIDGKLKAALPWFNMTEFMQMIRNAESLDGDVFDLLTTLGDFAAFKDWVLDYQSVPLITAVLMQQKAQSGQFGALDDLLVVHSRT